MITNIPRNVWSGDGLSTPDEDAILKGVVGDLQLAFNSNLYLDVNDRGSMATPQGQIAQSLTQIKGEINDNLRFLSNQINPKYSSGIYQDALAWLYFLVRRPATATVVQVECFGLDGAVIPIGIRINDVSGSSYESIDSGTILAGSVIITFQCVKKGAVLAPANSLTLIQQTVVGWESCNNPNAGVTGTNEETQQEFEERRFDSVAKNAHGTLSSIYANVFEVEGVIDVYATENVTNYSITVTGYVLIEHSIYVAVVGGSDEAVARAIFLKKDLGADYNGNTTVNIKDLNYSYPYPNYNVKFERPTELGIYFNVQVVDNPILPNNNEYLIKNAVVEAFNGDGGIERARIGSSILANNFVANIIKKVAYIQVLDINVGIGTALEDIIYVPIDRVPVISPTHVVVTYV